MDSTELLNRLARIYAAVGATISTDVDEIKVAQTDLPGGGVWLSVSTGPMTNAELEHAVYSAVHALAVFRNYAFKYAQDAGIDAAAIRAVMANCLALRIATDLDNKEKHPGALNNTSGVFPVLCDFRRPIQLKASAGRPATLQIIQGSPETGKPTIRSQNVDVVIFAMIKNAQTGGVVTNLDQLLEEGIAAWEGFLDSQGIKR
jgi:hypothetical protein